MDENQNLSPTDAAVLAKSGLSNADIAGLMGQNMRLNPYMAGAAVLSSLPSFYQAYEQNKELQRLKKEGVKDITPEAFKQYQAFVEQQAASSRLPGESIARDEIARQQAVAQSNIERLAQTPAQALKAALGANQQAIQARNQITMQGARDQARRRSIANEAMLKRAMFQEQARKEYAATLGALEGAKMQNINKGIQGGISGLLNSFVLSGANKPINTVIPGGSTTTPYQTTETGAAVPSFNTTPYGAYGNVIGRKDVPYGSNDLFQFGGG
jgi:hypothetical protein